VPGERGKPGIRFPDPLQSAKERGFFPLRIPLGESLPDCLAGKTARGELPLETPRSVAFSTGPHCGSGSLEIVEPAFPFQAADRSGDSLPLVAAIGESAGELRLAARPDRKEAQGALMRRVG